MEETRAVAHLPHLDLEILHRRLPDEAAEQVLISLRAQPPIEAFARFLEAGPASAWLALNPFLAWQRAALALWAPWLQGAARMLPRSGAPRGANR
jgi:hypothetical protein